MMKHSTTLVLLTLAAAAATTAAAGDTAVASFDSEQDSVWDPKGYVMWCPCMGRFGNQVEYLLGFMRFAHDLDRTLILPPFIDFVGLGRAFPKFSDYFNVSVVRRYVRAIEVDTFVARFGENEWKPASRRLFCYGSPQAEICQWRNGQPSTDFWDRITPTFAGAEYYPGLTAAVASSPGASGEWMQSFPAARYPVITFASVPVPLPVERENYGLQQYLQWNDRFQRLARSFTTKKLERPFLGLHLRNGVDWKRSCEHATGSTRYMSSPQCLRAGEKVNASMCYPSDDEVLAHVRAAVARIGAKSVFVATDDRDLTSQLSALFSHVKVVRATGKQASPQLDQLILEGSDHFIGNCISSFTAAVARKRSIAGLTNEYFGLPIPVPAGATAAAADATVPPTPDADESQKKKTKQQKKKKEKKSDL